MVAVLVMACAAAGMHAPNASAATCRYSYDSNGYPVWSGSCPQVMSPGRFGPIRMGKTTVSRAKAQGFLAPNRVCGGRLDGVGAYNDWRRRGGKVVGWTGGRFSDRPVRTSRGLRVDDSLAKAKRLYPGLRQTGYIEIPYTPGIGWRIFSVRGKAGWLDFYVHDTKKRYNHFAVRAASISKPYTWALDGC